MNWSTRLRRWVRISTPPVRDGVDEADRGDGLAGAGRVLEPEAALGAGVLGGLLDRLLVLVGRLLLPVLRLLVGRELLVLLVELVAVGAVAVERLAVGVGRRGLSAPSRPSPLAVRPRRRPSTCCSAISSARVPGERVDLVRVEFGAVAQLRRLVGEQALQPEQQREVAAPLDRGLLGAAVELGQRGVERRGGGRCPGPAPRRPRRRAGTARGRTPGPLDVGR